MFSLLCPDYGSLALAPLKRSQDAESDSHMMNLVESGQLGPSGVYHDLHEVGSLKGL